VRPQGFQNLTVNVTGARNEGGVISWKAFGDMAMNMPDADAHDNLQVVRQLEIWIPVNPFLEMDTILAGNVI
jgi:hypothetical protein